MTDDIPDPDSTPPWPIPVPAPDAPAPIDHRLGPGDGPRAPLHDHARLPDVALDIRAVVEKTRALSRTARYPKKDALWRLLAPELRDAEERLIDLVDKHPDHDEAVRLLLEVTDFLY